MITGVFVQYMRPASRSTDEGLQYCCLAGTQLVLSKHMAKNMIRFKTKLFRPAESEKPDSWTFLVLPKDVSAKLPSSGMTAIEGTINGFPFQAMLEPDGQKSHWLKVDRKLRKAAGAAAGDD